MSAVEKVEEDESGTQSGAAPVAAAFPVPSAARKKQGRRTGRMALMALVPAALMAAGAYVWMTGGRYQETENANLRQAKVTIASEAAGRIVDVKVADNQFVKKGDVLFQVDPEPYRIALAEADAALASARLAVEQLRAAYSQAVAQERAAAGDLDYAKAQFKRATELADRGINARSSLDAAQRDLDKALEAHSAAVQGVASARAAMDGNPDMEINRHPKVLSALAARAKAAYALEQTTVAAPANGMISQASSFKVGQIVGVGTPLFSLVETDDIWVEANFKETQLTNMKPGQKAEIVLDTFPGHRFEATLEAIGAGTGAEFSLLPAQNATGNWVKVTQRIPVRLKLEGDLKGMALRTGMSASVEVDTQVSRGFASLFSQAIAAE